MGNYGRQWDNYGISWVNKGFRKRPSAQNYGIVRKPFGTLNDKSISNFKVYCEKIKFEQERSSTKHFRKLLCAPNCGANKHLLFQNKSDSSASNFQLNLVHKI